MRRLKFREVLVQGHIANRGAGLHSSFSVFKCYALSPQTFCAISACDIALLLFAALNKDCVYSGVTCCLGGEPSSSQISAIKKVLSANMTVYAPSLEILRFCSLP